MLIVKVNVTPNWESKLNTFKCLLTFNIFLLLVHLFIRQRSESLYSYTIGTNLLYENTWKEQWKFKLNQIKINKTNTIKYSNPKIRSYC